MNDELTQNEEVATGEVAQNGSGVAEDRAQEYLIGWKRAQADYANLQRETAEQRSQMGKFATAEVVRAFLPVYDYFKRAMQHVPPEKEQSESVKQWFVGATHIVSLFKTTLTGLGIEELETVGKPFDPATMEAVKEEYKEGLSAGIVLVEADGGYKLGDKIIKPARVIIAANEPKPSEGGSRLSPPEEA